MLASFLRNNNNTSNIDSRPSIIMYLFDRQLTFKEHAPNAPTFIPTAPFSDKADLRMHFDFILE
jgi:hypothetical protein